MTEQECRTVACMLAEPGIVVRYGSDQVVRAVLFDYPAPWKPDWMFRASRCGHEYHLGFTSQLQYSRFTFNRPFTPEHA